MARRRVATLALLFSIPLSSCSESPTVVSGAAVASYIAAVLVADAEKAGILHPGQPPASGAGPAVTAPGSVDGITGGSAAVQLNSGGAFRNVLVYVEGVDGYWLAQLPYDLTTANVIITVGGRAPLLDFDVVFAVAGANGVWGPGDITAVSALEVAGGDVQVSVSWNTDADVDLHVIEPNGEELYYGNVQSATGGVLDIDANAACGTSPLWQENVGWGPRTARSGRYTVRVDYWSSCGNVQTDYVVTVYLRSDTPTLPGSPGSGVQLFTGSFTGDGTGGGAGDGVHITDFVF